MKSDFVEATVMPPEQSHGKTGTTLINWNEQKLTTIENTFEQF